MNRLSRISVLMVVLCLVAGPVFLAAAEPSEKPAQPTAAPAPPSGLTILAGAAFGAGLVMVGAGYGIGRIASCAVESMARQPEVASNIQTSMLITAAMLEGVALIALIVCMVKL
jgi:F-type H+-transporting ATPase subunit c